MPDPIPRSCGILTRGEFDACIALLQELASVSRCASIALTWTREQSDAWGALTRSGYACRVDPRSSSFRWSRFEATKSGLEWLRQVMGSE